MNRRHLEARACPACGSLEGSPEIGCRRPAECLSLRELRAFWSGLDKERMFFTYRRCARCRLLYNSVYFSPRVLSELYGGLSPNMGMVPAPMLARTQQGYLDAAIAAGARLRHDYLEIGPDVGHLVAHAAQRGEFERFWLFEPNRAVHGALAAATGGRPSDLSERMDDLSAVPDASVGLAVMVHVLDHLLDPLEMVRQLRAKLRPDGMLAIVTHNEGSVLRRLLGRRWPPFCLQHPQLYAPATIERLLHRAGFGPVAIQGATNHFPSDFLIRQAAQAAGMKLATVPMPSIPLRLRLGNILTLARKPAQAAARSAFGAQRAS